MTIDRMQQLARDHAYEPARGVLGDPAPEPLRDEVRELPIRLGGRRLFVAVDADGELRAMGLMEHGGDRKRLAVQLYAALDASEPALRLRAI